MKNKEKSSSELHQERLERLKKMPYKEFLIRKAAFEAAEKKWRANYKERLEKDPEFAKRHYENLEKRGRGEEKGSGEQK